MLSNIDSRYRLIRDGKVSYSGHPKRAEEVRLALDDRSSSDPLTYSYGIGSIAFKAISCKSLPQSLPIRSVSLVVQGAPGRVDCATGEECAYAHSADTER